MNETKTNFSNSKIFISYFSNSGGKQSQSASNAIANLQNDADCHIEANAYIISSFGPENCSFSFVGLEEWRNNSRKIVKELESPSFWLVSISTLVFSAFGYAMLIFYCCREEDKNKKYFLRLIALYLGVSFLVMYPVIEGGFAEFRYFNYAFFLPFIFLGFLINYLSKKIPKLYWIAAFVLFILFAAANIISISASAQRLLEKNRTNTHLVILGEAEMMERYLEANSDGQKEAYLGGDYDVLANLYKALAYLGENRNFNFIRVGDGFEAVPSAGKPFFCLKETSSKHGSGAECGGRKIEFFKDFGRIIICKLEN